MSDQGTNDVEAAAKGKLERTIEEVGLWWWLHPMQFMPMDAALLCRSNGAGEDPTEQGASAREREREGEGERKLGRGS